MSLEIVPISFAEANVFVQQYHRHHKRVVGTKFCIAAAERGKVEGVVIVGRPVARYLDNGWTLEINRCCTSGHKNACSILYAAAWRAAKAIGYKKLITYTLPEEGGASLRGAGWKCLGEAGGGSWSSEQRPRVDTHPQQKKLCWEAA